MMPLYRKLNYLVSNVAPEYHVESGRIMTPYMKLTVGDYLNRVPGVLSSVRLKWQKNYPWEIGFDQSHVGDSLDASDLKYAEQGFNNMDGNMLILPHVLDVTVAFKPIHNFLPQKSMQYSPFILPHESQRALNEGQKWYKKPVVGKKELGTTADNIRDAMSLGHVNTLETSNYIRDEKIFEAIHSHMLQDYREKYDTNHSGE